MGEDIKVLEEILNDIKADKNKACYVDRDSLIFPIIENLIADNKRLDKENQALFEAYNFNDTNLLARILKEYRKEILNSIPKSKVQEVLDEFGKQVIEDNTVICFYKAIQKLVQEGDK